jgi:hypothetical protein
VLAARVRMQAVARQRAAAFDQLDQGLRIRLALLLLHHEELLAIDHAAAVGEGEVASSSIGRQRLVGLADDALLEHRLVGAARGQVVREDHHAGRLAVEAVDRRQVRQRQLALQAHQQGLAQEAPGRDHRQEVRLVDHQQVLVLEQDLFLERDRGFFVELAVVPDAHALAHLAVGSQGLALRVDHVAARQALAPGRPARRRSAPRGRPACRRAGLGEPQVAGRDAVAHRQRDEALASAWWPILTKRTIGTYEYYGKAAAVGRGALAARVQRQQHVHVLSMDLLDAVLAARVGRQQLDRRPRLFRAAILFHRAMPARGS